MYAAVSQGSLVSTCPFGGVDDSHAFMALWNSEEV
jgi:hypothetical protein